MGAPVAAEHHALAQKPRDTASCAGRFLRSHYSSSGNASWRNATGARTGRPELALQEPVLVGLGQRSQRIPQCRELVDGDVQEGVTERGCLLPGGGCGSAARNPTLEPLDVDVEHEPLERLRRLGELGCPGDVGPRGVEGGRPPRRALCPDLLPPPRRARSGRVGGGGTRRCPSCRRSCAQLPRRSWRPPAAAGRGGGYGSDAPVRAGHAGLGARSLSSCKDTSGKDFFALQRGHVTIDRAPPVRHVVKHAPRGGGHTSPSCSG